MKAQPEKAREAWHKVSLQTERARTEADRLLVRLSVQNLVTYEQLTKTKISPENNKRQGV